jgi:hypothetical protein
MSSNKLRVMVHGAGQIGLEVVRQSLARDDIELVCILSDRIQSNDLSALGIGPQESVVVSPDQSHAFETDAVIFCGLATPQTVFQSIKQHVLLGRDVVTVTGLVDPDFSLGPIGASNLESLALEHGSRVTGTGWNPGFVLDVLPANFATTVPNVTAVKARRFSDISTWGHRLLDELGIGAGDAEHDFDSSKVCAHLHLAESASLIAKSLGLHSTQISTSCEPIFASEDMMSGNKVVSRNSLSGFTLTASTTPSPGGAINLLWKAEFGLKSELQGERAEVEILGDIDICVTAEGSAFSNPYPATGARALSTARSLQVLPPGVYRPDQVPFSSSKNQSEGALIVRF